MSVRQIGNYRIIDYIGSGGFGSVFRAEDISTPGRVVAVKELHKKHTRSAVIKQRFFQEALAMARLAHPNLPKLHTFGEDNGCYYLVMEFISGQLLSDELHEKGPVDPARAASIISQVLDALGYAHRNGIIHRDLKPDNIILIEDGDHVQVKVLDFGIARMVGGENLTMTGQGIGTPTYMSPERIKGETGIDHRTDIYSAGIVLFEMLSGYAPFASKASDPALYWAEMRTLHESQPVPTLSPEIIPAELENIVSKATSKNIEDRYPTAEDMIADLGRLTDKRVSRAIEPKTSRLMLVTAPVKAEIFVDNLPRGTSDSETGRMMIENLAPGVHQVRVTKNGYDDYTINVALEEGRKTDLQVSLAARPTIVVDRVDDTGRMEAETIRLESGDELATAVLTVEGLPAGSAVFVDSKAVATAGEDGRITVRLDTGVHNLQATAPSGDAINRLITIKEDDIGSMQTMTFPLGSGPTTGPVANVTQAVAHSVTEPEPSKTGKRLAAAVAVVLLLALAATAFFVMRGPSRQLAQEPEIEQTVPAEELTAEDSAAQAEELSAKTAEDSAAVIAQKNEIEAEKKKLEAERKRLEAEKKDANQQVAAVPGLAPVPAPEAVPLTPAAPETPPSATPDKNACVVVAITGPEGQTAPPGIGVVLTEQPENSRPSVRRGVTNINGRWGVCGLTQGSRIRIAVFSRRGALQATRQAVVTSGQNFITVQVDRPAGSALDSDEEERVRLRRKPLLRKKP